MSSRHFVLSAVPSLFVFRFKKQPLLLLLFTAISYGCFSQPFINSVSPLKGPVGTSVTITGSNFSSVATDNTVFFGAVRAAVTAATSSALAVTAPAGATLQPITVTVNGLTGYAPNGFSITYTGGGDINSTSFVNRTDYATDLYPSGLVVKDFDGDGKADLAVPNNYSISGQPASINVLRNTSTPGNVSLGTKQAYAAGTQTADIATADLDGDGKPDLVSTSIGNSNFSAFRNTSTPGTISFAAGITTALANAGFGIAVGDVDGDGKPDVALAGYLSTSLSIFRNTSTPGTISFAPKVDFTTVGGSEAITMADIDGDGKADVVVANTSFNTVSVFRSASTAGTIAFGPRADLSLSGATNPKGLLLTDLSGDDKPDLQVVVKFSSGYCGTRGFRNNSTPGNISFGLDNGMITNNGDASRVAAGDVNGDGIPDLALGEISNSRVSVGQNTGVGGGLGYISFRQALPFYALYSFATGLADLDGDGKPELISTFGSGSTLSIYRNNCGQAGISSFTPNYARTGETVTINGNYLSGVTSVTFGGVPATSFTVNNANRITAVVGNGASGEVAVSGSTGSASLPDFNYLQVPVVSSFSPTSAGGGNTVTITGSNFTSANEVRFGGKPARSFTVESATTIKAIVDTTGATGAVQVSNNNGAGSQPGFTYTPVAITSISPASAGAGATVTITGNNFTGANAVSFGGTPATSFTLVSPTTITAVVGGGSSGTVTVKNTIAQADFSGFIFASPPAPLITSTTAAAGVVPGNTIVINGSNFSPVAAANTVYLGATKGNVVAASANQLTVTVPYGATYGQVTVLNNSTGLVGASGPLTPGFAGNGILATTSFSNRLDVVMSSTFRPADALAADFDQDGKPDLIFTGVQPSKDVMLIKNNSTTGSLSLAGPVALNIAPADHIKVADIDGDGKADIITSPNNTTVGIARNTSNTGNISFAPIVTVGVGAQSQMLDVRDMDGDGKPDIICPNFGTSNISILRNTGTPGTISFAVRQDYTCSGYTIAAAAGDFDRDGRPDVAVISYNNPVMNIFSNTSTPGNISLVPAANCTVGDFPIDVKLVDIDGDNLEDIIVLNSNSASYVSVFKNTSTTGIISFASRIDYAVTGSSGFRSNRLDAGDLDGDGKVDIVASTGNINLFKNLSTAGTLALSAAMPISYGYPSSACVADLDADKKPELIIAQNGWYQYSVFKNATGETLSRNLCPPTAYTSITSNVTAQSYQWMVNTGSGLTALSNNANYSGTTTATLSLNNIPSAWSGYQYVCKCTNSYGELVYSNSYVVKFVNTWTGSAGTAWENPSNWSCGTVPDSNTDVKINSGTVVVSSNITVGSLSLVPGVNLTVRPGYNLIIRR